MGISRALIAHMRDNDLFDEFAVFCQYKTTYVSGVVFASTLGKASEKVNAAKTTYKKYMKVFMEEKWCEVHNEHTCFISYDRLCILVGLSLKEVKKQGYASIPHQPSVAKMKFRLREALVDKNIERQHFNDSKGIDTDSSNPNGKVQAYAMCSTARLSVARIGSLIGLSPSSGWRLRKQLEAHGSYMFINESELLECGVPSRKAFYAAKEKYTGYVYLYGDRIYRRLAARAIKLCNDLMESKLPRMCYDPRLTKLEALAAPIGPCTLRQGTVPEDICRWLGKAFIWYNRARGGYRDTLARAIA